MRVNERQKENGHGDVVRLLARGILERVYRIVGICQREMSLNCGVSVGDETQ
jgi:hypothetical protein